VNISVTMNNSTTMIRSLLSMKVLLTCFLLAVSFIDVSAQGVVVAPSIATMADTAKTNLDQLKDKYEDMSGEQIEKFKQYQQRDGSTPPDGIMGDESEGHSQDNQEKSKETIEEGNVAEEAAEKIIEAVAAEMKESLGKVGIYGFKYFRESTTKIYTSAQDVKPPEDYELGVSDQLNIAIWGFADYNEVFTIDKDGYIQPKYVGRIYLKGLTLKNAREVIRARYSRAYMIENSQFDISLNYSRVINVNVVGEVEFPGSYTIPAVNTVFNLMSFIGGPTEMGSIRNIQIKRNGQVIRRFDLYKFLNEPEKQDDYFLQNNDYVYVPMSTKIVKISGAVQRPFKYELLENESFEDLLRYAGGYLPKSLTSYIQIERYIDNKLILIDVDLDSLRKSGRRLDLMNGDQITVREIPDRLENPVSISGSVKVAGKYELKPGNRLSDIVNRAMGLAENAYTQEAYIFRLDPGTEGRQVIRVNLERALADYQSEDNILLQTRDDIRVFAANYFLDQYSIDIRGAVRKPTIIEAQKGLTLRDGILYSAGLEPHAYLKRAYIRRVNREDNSYYYVTVELDTADNYAKMDEVPLFQGDVIRILSNLTFTVDQVVSISGQVRNPGTFELWREFNLKDLVLLAGGFTEKAFFGKVMVYRTRPDFKEEVITFSVDTSDFQQQLQDFSLQRGDRVIVFSQNIFLRDFDFFVGGLVNEPGSFELKENMVLADALLLARGFSLGAASNRIEIARISNFEEAVTNSAPTQINIDILDVGKDFLNDAVAISYVLRPYDQVFVRKIPNFEFQKRITLSGEVVYPGDYVLKSKNERLSSVIERAGGLTEFAFAEGAKLSRSYSRTGNVLLDLKKALRRPGSKYNYILKEGDQIEIPTVNNLVTVRGQIDYPFEENDMKRLVAFSDSITIEEYIQITPEKKVSVPFTSGKSAKYYIKKYGSGFGTYAKKKDTYVVLPNGHVKGTRFLLITRVYPRVTLGSEVVVPREPLKLKKIRKQREGGQGLEKFLTVLQVIVGSLTTTLTLFVLTSRAF
jgi:polysaccharide biosynthesis/export protein